MTGLNLDTEHIIQIACFVTDYDLNLLDEKGFETVVHQPESVMNGMDEWCTKTHMKTGLTPRVLASKVTPEEAAKSLLEYVQKYVPVAGKAILAGNSVHYDKEFLRKQPYRPLIEHLHHRILDVSAIKEAARRWSPKEVWKHQPKKLALHEAKQDILESIAEARYYREVFFQEPNLDRLKAEKEKEKENLDQLTKQKG
jgi:oligoribonuclease